jgi:hypothetical protein
MTYLWENYCSAVARTAVIPAKIKTRFLAQRILESGRGTSRQAVELLNFGAMMRKPELDYLCRGWVKIDRYDYAAFWTFEEEFKYYWALVHRKIYYPDTDLHIFNGRDFIDYIGRHGYCPPGYPGSPAHEKWVRDTGFQTYTDYVEALVPEAKAQLLKYGFSDEEVPVPIPQSIPTPISLISITDGISTGPNVKYSWVKNFDHFDRPSTIGIVLHEPDAHGTPKDYIGQGLLNDWNIPSKKKSAHGVVEEDGTFLQTVDFTKPAWHAGAWNMSTLGFEFANIGPFWPWQEIFGWFYRFRNQPWEQKIRKSDMVLINGMYWSDYTKAQIETGKELIIACDTYFKKKLLIEPHSALDNQRADPGPFLQPLFNWAKNR